MSSVIKYRECTLLGVTPFHAYSILQIKIIFSCYGYRIIKVLYLFCVIGDGIDAKGYPNERKGNHFIGIEAFTEIEDGDK